MVLQVGPLELEKLVKNGQNFDFDEAVRIDPGTCTPIFGSKTHLRLITFPNVIEIMGQYKTAGVKSWKKCKIFLTQNWSKKWHFHFVQKNDCTELRWRYWSINLTLFPIQRAADWLSSIRGCRERVAQKWHLGPFFWKVFTFDEISLRVLHRTPSKLPGW